MGLRLNSFREGNRYEEFYGKFVEQMPKIMLSGKIPLSTRTLLRRRLEISCSEDKLLRGSWEDNYFFTGDALFYNPNGRIKFVTGSELIKSIGPRSTLARNGLVISTLEFDSAAGLEISADDLTKMGGLGPFTSREAKNHLVWQYLSGWDNDLLSQYVDTFFPERRKSRGYDKNMAIYLDFGSPLFLARALVVCELVGRSDLLGSCSINDENGRLVGETK